MRIRNCGNRWQSCAAKALIPALFLAMLSGQPLHGKDQHSQDQEYDNQSGTQGSSIIEQFPCFIPEIGEGKSPVGQLFCFVPEESNIEAFRAEEPIDPGLNTI